MIDSQSIISWLWELTTRIIIIYLNDFRYEFSVVWAHTLFLVFFLFFFCCCFFFFFFLVVFLQRLAHYRFGLWYISLASLNPENWRVIQLLHCNQWRSTFSYFLRSIPTQTLKQRLISIHFAPRISLPWICFAGVCDSCCETQFQRHQNSLYI